MAAGRVKRVLIISAAVLAAVFLAAALVLPRLIDLNTYHDRVVREAEAALNRPVRLGEMRLSLLPPVGVRIHDAAIGAAAAGGPDLVEVGEIAVRLRILPLLRREIAVGSVVLQRPAIVLHRLSDGRWDLPGIGAAGEGARAGAPSASAPPASAPSGQPPAPEPTAPPSIAIERLRIKQGRITLVDESGGGSAPTRAGFEGVDVTASFAARAGTMRGSAGGSIERLSVAIPGGAEIRDGRLEISGSIESAAGTTSAELASLRFTYGESTIAGSASIRTGPDAVQAALNLDSSTIRPADLTPIAARLGMPLPGGLFGPGDVALALQGRAALGRDAEGGWTLRDLEVPEMTLNGVHLRLGRNAGGELVFAGEPAAPAAPPPRETGGAEPARPATAAGEAGGLPLRIGRLRVGDARIEYRDEALAPAAPLELDLHAVSLDIDDLAPGQPARIRLRASLPDRADLLDLQGTITHVEGASPADWPLDIRMQVRRFPLDRLSGLLANAAGVRAEGGEVGLDINARGLPAQSLALAGRVGIHEARAAPIAQNRTREAGAGPAAAIDCDVAFDLEIGGAGRRVGIRDLSFSFPTSRLAASGSFERRSDGIWVDLDVPESRVTAGDIRILTPAVNLDFPPGLTASEPIVLRGKVSGPLARPAELKVSGSIDLRHVRFETPALGQPVEDVGARVEFTRDSITVRDLGARLGGTDISGSLGLESFAAPRVRFDLSSSKADLGEIFALLKPGPASAAPERATGAGPGRKTAVAGPARDTAAAPSNPLVENTTGRGTLRIKEGVLENFKFADFEGTVTMNGLVLDFDPLAFRLYEGTYRGAATADLRGAEPRYTYRMRLEGVRADPLIADNLGIADLFGGVVTADLQLAGAGSDYERIVNALDGSGSIRVVDGWVGRLNVMDGIAKAADLFGEATLRDLGRAVASEKTPFRELTGEVNIRKGRVSARNLKLLSDQLDLLGKGSFSMTGDLDFDLKVVFSEALSRAMDQEGSRGRYLGREGGRYAVPLKITGSLLSPEFGLDLRQIVAAAGKRKLEDKILDAIGGERADKLRALTGRGGPTPAETPAGAASPPAAEGTPAPGAAAAQPPAAAAPPATGAAMSATGAATSATGEATPATGAATPALAIEVTRSRLSGNFLRPDLRVEGSFVGPGIDHADLTVTGRDGRVLHEKQRAFPEIDAYFAGRDRREVATIPFFIKVERLTLAVGGVQVTIVLHATDGTRVERTVSADR